MINIGLQTVLALVIAVLMHRLTQVDAGPRGIVLLPYLVANVVVALVWFWMLDYQLGIVNQVLDWHRHRPDRVLRQRALGDPDHRAASTSGGTWATPRC